MFPTEHIYVFLYYCTCSVMTWTKSREWLYVCTAEHGDDVCVYRRGEESWELDRVVAQNDNKLLMLHLTHDENHLIGTFMLGFQVGYITFRLFLLFIGLRANKKQ